MIFADAPLIIKGLIIGLVMAMPIGPVSIVCIRRSLVDRLAVGLAAGFGAATADGLFGFVAAYGISEILNFIQPYTTIIRFFGGIFLGFLGYATFVDPTIPHIQSGQSSSIFASYFSALGLTLSNPLIIIPFGALLTVFKVSQTAISSHAISIFALGVFIGSACWFALLSVVANQFKSYCNAERLRTVTRISGVLIALLGLLAIGSIIFH